MKDAKVVIDTDSIPELDVEIAKQFDDPGLAGHGVGLDRRPRGSSRGSGARGSRAHQRIARSGFFNGLLDSYKHVYETYVKPTIGKPTMLTPRAHHSFMTHDKWKSLAADAMPERMGDTKSVPNGRLRSGIREAIVACHGEVDESSWHDCLQGNPDDPTEVT